MKHIFIVNETSGVTKERIKYLTAIREVCTTLELDFEIRYTNSKNHAKAIAEIASMGSTKNVLYSVGGDGSLNHIVNSANLRNITIGIIPVGTGNDAYKSLVSEEPFSLTEDLPRLLSDEHSEVTYHDLIAVNGKIATNFVSTGVDAKSCDNIKYLRKVPFLSNKGKYTLGALAAIIQNRTQNLTTSYLDSDSEVSVKNTQNLVLAAVFNGQYYGSKYHMSPNSSTTDGLFNVIEAHPMPRMEIIKLFGGINAGKHLTHDKITTFETTTYQIDSEEPILCNIDGEISTTNQMDISLAPVKLRLRRPIK